MPSLENQARPRADATMFAGQDAEAYGGKIRQRVPGYEALHEVAAAWLATVLPAEARILVVGAGDGEDLIRLAAAGPAWRLSGVEPAPGMLAVARRRIEEEGLASRVTTHEGYVSDLPAEPAYDAAVVILVSHFIPDDGQREAFFREVRRRLTSNARLICADLLQAPAEVATAGFAWMSLRGLSVEALAAVRNRLAIEFHLLEPARLHAILGATGFGPAVPLYQALAYAMIATEAV